MKVWTVCEDEITEGAVVGAFKLANGTAIPAIVVGEEGRGRELGVLPVQLTPNSYKKWSETGKVAVSFGRLGQTKSGRPKLIEEEAEAQDGEMLIVLPTPIGYRGDNKHYLPSSAEVVVKGWIAEGIAGRMGAGAQMIVRLPADAAADSKITIKIGGRRYGAPHRYTYLVSDGRISIEDEVVPDADEFIPNA